MTFIGAIRGSVPELPPLLHLATSLDACEYIIAETSGVIVIAPVWGALSTRGRLSRT